MELLLRFSVCFVIGVHVRCEQFKGGFYGIGATGEYTHFPSIFQHWLHTARVHDPVRYTETIPRNIQPLRAQCLS